MKKRIAYRRAILFCWVMKLLANNKDEGIVISMINTGEITSQPEVVESGDSKYLGVALEVMPEEHADWLRKLTKGGLFAGGLLDGFPTLGEIINVAKSPEAPIIIGLIMMLALGIATRVAGIKEDKYTIWAPLGGGLATGALVYLSQHPEKASEIINTLQTVIDAASRIANTVQSFIN